MNKQDVVNTIERKGFDVPDFIYDNFDTTLLEAEIENDYYTVDEVKALVTDRINSLNKLGYNISADQIIEYTILEGTHPTAGIKSVAENKYKFVIAKLAARRKNDKYLNTIIYHELCHILQLEFLFNNTLLYYEDNKLKGAPDRLDLINRLYVENKGHTDLWYTYVNKVNKTLMINPPIEQELTNKDLVDIFLENTFKKEGFELDVDGFEDDFGYSKYLSEKGNTEHE